MYLYVMPGETITVESAIKKGRWQLFYIPSIIFFASLALSMSGLYFLDNGTIWIPFWGFSSFACVFILPMLYYFFMLPRWRIWAFGNVRNVHELKQRALLGQIYPKDNSFWWRLEIKNATQKEQIETLESKFNQPDIFVDDPNIPYETSYSHSQFLNLFYLLFTIVGIVSAITLLIAEELLIGFFVLIGFSFLVRMTYKRYKQKKPVLIISNDGITLNKDGIVSEDEGVYLWKDITDEHVFFINAGDASKYVFAFDAFGTTKELDLRELTGLSSYKIDHILRTYRGRYEASLKK